jgi:hypothetical protein
MPMFDRLTLWLLLALFACMFVKACLWATEPMRRKPTMLDRHYRGLEGE